MLRSNRLVKITVDQLTDLSLIVFALEIPVFFYRHNNNRVDRPLWAELPDDLLVHTTMSISPWTSGHHGYRTMLILEEDHDTLVRILAEEYAGPNYTNHEAILQVLIRHNGAAWRQQAHDSAQADQLATKLLTPYGKHFKDFKGYDNAVIAHGASASVNHAIMSQMRIPQSLMQKRLLALRQNRNKCLAARSSPWDKEMSLRQSYTELFLLAKWLLPAHPGSVIPNAGAFPNYVVTAPSAPEAETRDLLRDIADEYVFILMCSALVVMPASAGYSSEAKREALKRYSRVVELMSQLPLVGPRIIGAELLTGSTSSWAPNAKHVGILRERARLAIIALDEAESINKQSSVSASETQAANVVA